MSIGILDYGMGNVKSLGWAFDRLGVPNKIVNSLESLGTVNRLVIPGVGSFGTAIQNIRSLGLFNGLIDYVKIKDARVLGICLGMHILFESSEESPGIEGLSVLRGKIKKLNSASSPLPHVGWNSLETSEKDKPLFLDGIPASADFYFVHRYGLLDSVGYACTVTERPDELFVSSVQYENISCVQFHPEKSHLHGLMLLKNWLA